MRRRVIEERRKRKTPKEGREPATGKKARGLEDEKSKTPETGRGKDKGEEKTPREGREAEVNEADKKTDFETFSRQAGGAVSLEVQTDLFEKAGKTLMGMVKSAVTLNWMQEISLEKVGPLLLRCMKICCKPLTMAEDDKDFLTSSFPLASTVAAVSNQAIWEGTILLALSSMAGEEDPRLSDFVCNPMWKKSLAVQLPRFDIWREQSEMPTFEKYFTSKSIDYAGEEVKVSLKLDWRAVSRSLPEGVGRLNLADFCTLGTKAYIENFEEFLLPSELQERVKPPKVMIVEHGWDELCQGLIERKLCQVMPLAKVHHVNGEPLLNGLFAVGKGEVEDGVETQRLMMNSTPVNAICRELRGDISTLPNLGNLGLMIMSPEEEVLVSSEDVRCFFYLFRTPETWWKYMGFNRIVPEHLVPRELQGQDCVLCATVLPMGFCNSVSIAQHIHRQVVNQAAASCDPPLMGEGEIRRDKGFPRKQDRYRIYLDNFDQLEIHDKETANLIKGTTSNQVDELRKTYEAKGIPRHPKKAVQRQARAEVQGALLLGDMGIATAKPTKILQYLGLTLWLLRKGEAKLKELQVVVGGLVYLTTFRRPLLSALNEVWIFMERLKLYPPVVKLALPDKVVRELVRFLCLIPLAQVSFTPRIEGLVTCSDASLEGGGICRSIGLSPYGLIASQAPVRGDIPEPHDFVQVLSVGLFDGISGLRVACDLIGLPMIGHISIECDASARRVVESFFPDTVFHDDVTTVNEDFVRDMALKFSGTGIVLLGAGPPCQGVSGLNSDRRGALKDHRSCLFQEVPRIEELFRKHFFWAQVQSIKESVASMSDTDCDIMSKAFGDQPWRIDSQGLTLCRRPRLYWVTWELQQQEHIAFQVREDGKREVVFDNLAEQRKFLEGNSSLAGENLPTFTTARPSSVPGRKPAGLHMLNKVEKERWIADWHRFPPYQYAFKCGVLDGKNNWRLPSLAEREINMGFPLGYTKSCVAKSLQKGWEFENTRMSLLGNSWHVGIIAWLLGQLFHPLGLCEPMTPQEVYFRLCPGQGRNLQGVLLRPPLGPQRAQAPEGHEVQLVGKLMGITSAKGEDLLLQGSSEHTVKFHRLRASIPSRLWKWRDVAGWKWRSQGEHINQLELRAVHTTLKWWVKKKRVSSVRFLHLVDSLVGLHALSRGRTSSRKLRRTVMRINSVILGGDLHPLWGYVHTSQNPADRPSRRGHYVKTKWGKWRSTLKVAQKKSAQRSAKS